MGWIFENLLQFFTSMITGAADLLGNGILGLLCLDIGSGGSFFDIVFSSIGDFFGYFQIMALSILAINFVWQNIKTMVAPDGAGETPLAIIARTFVAGFLIFNGTTLVWVFEGLFNKFYSYLLTVEVDGASMQGTVAFTEMSQNFASAVNSNPEESLGLGGLLLVLLLSILIIYQFVMFMIEVVERYVVLGFLYYTSPLAFAMFGSKSTGGVFASWVRMVGSQMFLMVTNVIFFRLFLEGFSNYEACLSAAQAAYGDFSELALVVVWALLLSGILNVGTKVDNYLGTLGLNAAQTGRGLAASVVAAGLGVRRTFDSVRGLGQAAAHSPVGRFVGKHVSQGAKSGAQSFSRTVLNKGAPVSRDGTTGAVSGSSIIDKMNNKTARKDDGMFQGARAAMGFQKAASSSIPESALNKIDTNSFKMNSDGSVSMRWNAGAKNEAQITAVPLSGPNASNIDTTKAAGRVFSITGEDGQKMQMFATAQGAGAKEFMSYNPPMAAKMQQFAAQPGCTATEISPGVWQTTRTDSSGNIVEAKQYASANLYQADTALGSHVETVGGMSYHVSDVTSATVGATRMETPIAAGMTQQDMTSHISTQIPEMSQFTPTQVVPDAMGASSGVYTFTDGTSGQRWAVAPAAEYAVAPGAEGTPVQTMRASNGAAYVAAPIGPNTNVNEIFTQRSGVQMDTTTQQVTGVYAQPLTVVDDISQFSRANAPLIYSEAQRRSNDRNNRNDGPKNDGGKRK